MDKNRNIGAGLIEVPCFRQSGLAFFSRAQLFLTGCVFRLFPQCHSQTRESLWVHCISRRRAWERA